jgi:uncharacterized protein (DUF488 family)
VSDPRPQLLTFGHGTLPQDDVVGLLQGAGVRRLVDVRRFPGSRRHPHVARDELEQWLPAAGVGYRWEPRLGGRRRSDPAEPDVDVWWQVEAFRAYAAHTRTDDFRSALDELLTGAARARTAVMCSETVWWRCHRRLISDVAVLLHDVEVQHLGHDGRLSPHRPAAGARITAEGLVYDVRGGDAAGSDD